MWKAIYHEFRRWAKASDRVVAACKKTEITLETDRIWIIRKSHTTWGWCAECGREVEMVGLQEAEVLWGIARPLITTQPMLPGGRGDCRGWHWSEAADGSPLVCVESLRMST